MPNSKKPLIISNKKKTIIEVVLDLFSNKNLIFELTKKDFKTSFAQSILGVSYFILSPVAQAVVITFFVELVVKKESMNFNSFYFYLVSMTIWNFFFNLVNKTSGIFLVNRKYLVKLYFNRLTLFVASTNISLLTFFINLIILILFGFFFLYFANIPFTINLNYLLILPLATFIILLSVGLGLIFSSLSIKYRDIIYGINYILQLIFFITPAVVTLDEFTGYMKLFFLVNPITGALEVMRWIIIDGYNGNFDYLLINIATSLLICLFGLWLFTISDKKIVDII